MEVIRSYQDLCREIDILETRIQNLESEYEFWQQGCFHKDKKPPAPLDICLQRMDEIVDQVVFYERILKEKERTKAQIEKRINEFDGIEYQVAYRRDVKGMTIAEIAADMGYSEIWIKKISSRIKKWKNPA